MIFRRALFLLLVLPLVRAHAAPAAPQQRVQELKDFVKKERPGFERRASERKGLIDELDRLNEAQNRLRGSLSEAESQSQELAVALDNMSLELERQRAKVTVEKQRAQKLLHAAYRMRRDGLILFILEGGPVAALGKLRTLNRALRLRKQERERLDLQARRLTESESKLMEAKTRVAKLWEESRASQDELARLLLRKKSLLSEIDRKQTAFVSASAELEKLSKRVNDLFSQLGTAAPANGGSLQSMADLKFPVEEGKIVKRFGREVHPQFHTVTFHKGLEIEAMHGTPVVAVLPGTVEFEGWLSGMGNVVIIHHGNGLYSLSGHLFRVVTSRGAEIAKGETIGFVGDTGASERPSLYFELRESQLAVDPLPYFSKEGMGRIG